MANIFSQAVRNQRTQQGRGRTIFSGVESGRFIISPERPERPQEEIQPISPAVIERLTDPSAPLRRAMEADPDLLRRAQLSAQIAERARQTGQTTLAPATPGATPAPIQREPSGRAVRFDSFTGAPVLMHSRGFGGQFARGLMEPGTFTAPPQGVAEWAGRILGEAIPFTAASIALGPVAGATRGALAARGASQLAQRILPIAAQEAGAAVLAGTAGRAGQVMEGDMDLQQAASEVAMLAGLGGASAGAIAAAGPAIGRAVQTLGRAGRQAGEAIRRRLQPAALTPTEQAETMAAAIEALRPSGGTTRAADAARVLDVPVQRTEAVPASQPTQAAVDAEPNIFAQAQRGQAASAGVQAMPATTPQEPLRRVTVPSETARAISLAQAKPSQIIRDLEKALGVPIRVGRFSQRARGIFKVRPEVIRTRDALDLDTISHEIGHFLDKRFKIANPLFDDELLTLGRRTSRPNYSQQQVREEGVAEFVRLYLTDPERAQQAAPRFYRGFREVLESVPDIDAALKMAQSQIEAYQSLPGKARILARISTDAGRPRRTTLDDLTTMLVDELRPLQRAVTRMAGGRRLSPAQDPFLAAWTARGKARKIQQALEDGIYDINGNKLAPGLREILRPVQNKLDDFRAYIVSRRARELAARGIKTGLDADDIEATLQQLDTDEFRAVFDQLQQYQDVLLDRLIESGILDRQSAARMRELNRDYIPFYRVFEESSNLAAGFGGRGYSNLAYPIHGIKGSSREIIDPIESIIKNTVTFIDLAERNEVARRLVQLARRSEGAGGIVEILPTPTRPHRLQLDELKTALRKAFRIDPEEFGLTVDDIIDLSQKADIWRPASASRKENILTAWENGKPVYMQVEPELYRTLMGLDKGSSHWLIDVLSIPARTLRRGAVLSPGFIMRNPIRDQVMAFIQSKYGYFPPIDFVRGLFSAIRRDNLYQQWIASGGGMATLQSLDRNYLRGTMNRMLRSERSLGAWIDRLNPINGLVRISELMEEATRLGEFSRGIRAGAHPSEAAIASRDISIDFGRAGTVGKDINRVTAFWNARIQGWNKLLREFRERPAQMTARAVASITLPSVALYVINRNNPAYWELPQWRRDLFWNIPYRGGEKFIMIPKPFELGVLFGALPERALTFIDQQDPNAINDLRALLGSEVGDANPFAFNGLLTLYELLANHSFFLDRPIVPQSEQNLPPELQYGPFQTQAARRIGELTGTSPRMIEHVLRGFGGNLPIDVLRAIDPLLGAAPSPRSTLVERIPGLSSFVADPFESSESVNRFYERVAELEREAAGAAITGERFTQQAELRRLRRTRERLAQLRNQRNEVLEDQSMTPEQKRQRLQRINLEMTNHARRALGLEVIR